MRAGGGTVLAVLLCFLNETVRDKGVPFYAAIAAVHCIQPNRQRSIRQAKERVAATFLDEIIRMIYLTYERYVYQVACELLRYPSLSILLLLVMQVSLCL